MNTGQKKNDSQGELFLPAREQRVVNMAFGFIVLCGLCLRLWNVTWGLPALYEEAYPLTISWKLWNWGHSGFDLNPHFFNYPALTFYLNFAIELLHYGIGTVLGYYHSMAAFQNAYEADASTFILLSRSLSIVLDVGSLVCVFLIAKEVAGNWAALLASLLFAINPLQIKESHLINVDTPLTFFALLSLVFICRLYRAPTKKSYIIAGISIGLAAATKYTGVLLFPLLLSVHLLRTPTLKASMRSLPSANLFASFACAFGMFLILNPYVVLKFDEFYLGFSFEQYHANVGHLGLDPNQGTIQFYFLESLPHNLGWPLYAISLGTIIFTTFQRKPKTLLPLFFFLLIYFIGIGFWKMRAERYTLPVISSFILFGSVGLTQIVKLTFGTIGKKLQSLIHEQILLQFAIGMAVLVVSGFTELQSTIRYQRSRAFPDTRAVTRDWISNNIPVGGAIAFGPYGIDLSKDRYALLPIPFHPVITDLVKPYYQPQWYEDFDAVIVSDYDYSRYAREPERMRDFLSFYDTLRSRWILLQEIKPREDQDAPTFWLYRAPRPAPHLLFDTSAVSRLSEDIDSARVLNFEGRLGLILAAKQQSVKSVQLLAEVVRLDSTNLLVHRQLGKIFYAAELWGDALNEFTIVTRLDPTDAESRAIRGDILIRNGELDEAEKELNKALALNNYLQQAYLSLNIIYASRSDPQSMIENLEKYRQILPPDSRQANIVSEQIRKLKAAL